MIAGESYDARFGYHSCRRCFSCPWRLRKQNWPAGRRRGRWRRRRRSRGRTCGRCRGRRCGRCFRPVRGPCVSLGCVDKGDPPNRFTTGSRFPPGKGAVLARGDLTGWPGWATCGMSRADWAAVARWHVRAASLRSPGAVPGANPLVLQRQTVKMQRRGVWSARLPGVVARSARRNYLLAYVPPAENAGSLRCSVIRPPSLAFRPNDAVLINTLRSTTGGGAHSDCGRAKPRIMSAPLAPVAQLDRALPSEGKGHTFESCRARQPFQWLRLYLQRGFLPRVRAMSA